MARGVAGTAVGGGGGDSSSNSYSAYGISVKENQALYNQYLGAYDKVLSGVQNIGDAQRQALSDFYAQKQGQSDQSMISRGLGNTTIVDNANRGLALDEGKAQNSLSEQVARMKADYESQMAGGIHNFMGGFSQSESQSYRSPMGGQQVGQAGNGGVWGPQGGLVSGGGRAIGEPGAIMGFGQQTGGTALGPQQFAIPQQSDLGGFSGYATAGLGSPFTGSSIDPMTGGGFSGGAYGGVGSPTAAGGFGAGAGGMAMAGGQGAYAGSYDSWE